MIQTDTSDKMSYQKMSDFLLLMKSPNFIRTKMSGVYIPTFSNFQNLDLRLKFLNMMS